ncbi:UNVERIFIED_CONTAM: hypothetical protein GTU68_044075 [Idotea baltica]|nr:hypothetical protein [Idotea baltica]
MFHLGVPTTRSLSLSLSGDQVLRDVLYDGNPAYEKGAIVCRVAPSFIRFGNFQIFASRSDTVNLKKLADYTIKHFFPEIQVDTKQRYVDFFNAVLDRTLEMVVHWQRVGFVHGVMNTDNMSILGLTIDYGPYGWLEGYEPGWTPNTTDSRQRRYRYGNQPVIAQWNLYQLANALYLLVEETAPFEAALGRYKLAFELARIKMMRAKLGLSEEEDGDESLLLQLEKILELTETDMTIFFRQLSNCKASDTPSIMLEKLEEASQWTDWLQVYGDRLQMEKVSDENRQAQMKQVNPKYVLRNYMAQLAIDAADQGNYGIIEELYQLLKKPYAEQPESEKWFARRPDWARDKVGCSMLSCSS